MPPSKPATVSAYLASLAEDRRAEISVVRGVILKNLDAGYEEGIQYGILGYHVPHRLYPAGYHTDAKQPLPFAALASQKNHLSLYLMGVYCGCDEGGETGEARWFRDAWAATGKKLDMGKACIRFKRADRLALDVIGEAIRRIPAKLYIERYEAVLARTRGAKKRAAPAAKRSASRA